MGPNKQVHCPDCNQLIILPEGVGPGDLIGCPDCAGLELRVKQRDGKLVAEEAARVSCPVCDKVLVLAEDVEPGAKITHCGREFTLTYEFRSYALEEK
ncbi:MAG: hypothetical protein V3S39_11225 [Thermodesulfobacteriota bacterium]